MSNKHLCLANPPSPPLLNFPSALHFFSGFRTPGQWLLFQPRHAPGPALLHLQRESSEIGKQSSLCPVGQPSVAPSCLTPRGPGGLSLPQPPPSCVTQALHGFPTAAGTNDRKASGFEHLTCISLQSWSSEIQNGSQWAKNQGLSSPSSFWRPEGKMCPVFFTFWRLLEFPGSRPHIPLTSASIITPPLPSHLPASL